MHSICAPISAFIGKCTAAFRVTFLMALISTFGCSEKKDPPAESKKVQAKDEAPQDDSAGANEPVALPKSPVAVPKPTTAGLPPLDLAQVETTLRKNAAKTNTLGVGFLKEKNYPKAIDTFETALKSDPGHLLARYNLACAHSLNGNTDEALRLLSEFKEVGCPACVGRLVRARDDSDWAGLQKDPRFLEITKDAAVNAPTTKEAALVVYEAYIEEASEKAAAVIHPRHEIIVYDLPGGSRDGEIEETIIVGMPGFATHLRDNGPTEMKLKSCETECCIFVPLHDDDRSLGTNLNKVCFKVQKDGFRHLVSLSKRVEM